MRSTPRPAHARRLRLAAEDGMSIVEVLVAIIVLAIGIVGTIGAFDSARKLNLLSERRTSMAHRAQLEIERLQAEPYSELAMISAPTHSSETTNPDYYVKEGTTKYSYNESGAEEEPFVVASKAEECTASITSGCGVVAASPSSRKCSEKLGACEWSDGEASGNVYDFITWYGEPNKLCKEEKPCPKRITVVVTAKVPSGNHEPHVVRVSTLVGEQ